MPPGAQGRRAAVPTKGRLAAADDAAATVLAFHAQTTAGAKEASLARGSSAASRRPWQGRKGKHRTLTDVA